MGDFVRDVKKIKIKNSCTGKHAHILRLYKHSFVTRGVAAYHLVNTVSSRFRQCLVVHAALSEGQFSPS